MVDGQPTSKFKFQVFKFGIRNQPQQIFKMSDRDVDHADDHEGRPDFLMKEGKEELVFDVFVGDRVLLEPFVFDWYALLCVCLSLLFMIQLDFFCVYACAFICA